MLLDGGSVFYHVYYYEFLIDGSPVCNYFYCLLYVRQNCFKEIALCPRFHKWKWNSTDHVSKKKLDCEYIEECKDEILRTLRASTSSQKLAEHWTVK